MSYCVATDVVCDIPGCGQVFIGPVDQKPRQWTADAQARAAGWESTFGYSVCPDCRYRAGLIPVSRQARRAVSAAEIERAARLVAQLEGWECLSQDPLYLHNQALKDARAARWLLAATVILESQTENVRP